MKIKYLWGSFILMRSSILFILFMSALNIIYAQTAKEKEFKNLNSKLELKDNQLLMLNNELKEKADFINLKKAQPDYDKNEIKELLSNTARLTNSIEKVQLERDSLHNKYEVVKSELFSYYTGKIDSVNKSNLLMDEKNALITRLIEKRLYVSPKIDILSFEPEKVLKISSLPKTSEHKIYDEFLTSAYQEIETKLIELKELKKEIGTIQTLNKETKTFLEEAEFDRDISYFNSNTQTASAARNLDYGETDVSGSYVNSIKTQSDSFSKILSQLELNNLPKERTYSLSNITKKNDLEEFKKLINLVEQQLEDYKIVINNKLRNH